MNGLVKTAAATPKTTLGAVDKNVKEIARLIREAKKRGVRLVVFPELALCGYTVGDLLLQSTLLEACERGLEELASCAKGIAAVVGLPLKVGDKLYDIAAVLGDGKVLGIVPKRNLPNYAEFSEKRYFSTKTDVDTVTVCGRETPFGDGLVFFDENEREFTFGVEICEDMWVAQSPSVSLALGGAKIICNPSASTELVGKAEFRRTLIKGHSAKLIAGYVYADCGFGESTTDCVFAGHRLIAEDGALLAESPLLTDGLTVTEIDVQKLDFSRRQTSTFEQSRAGIRYIGFQSEDGAGKLERKYSATPFLPESDFEERTEFILSLQAAGLMQRMRAAKTSRLTLGLSGGLDSTLALIVAVKAAGAGNVTAVTMPCFGTGERTLNNARALTKALGVKLKEIPIAESVKKHFEDIGHDINVKNTVYENAQARERTQILLDMANADGSLVVGTGDLSELALGWATYNGDHISSYGVNASVPKTLVKFLVKTYARMVGKEVGRVLGDIAETEISPELLPPKDGKITQKTEDIIGRYEYHDFFIYYGLRWGFTPKKVMYLALNAFGEDKKEEIKKAMKTFWSRFFSQQFKRSCLPDGAKVGTVSLSPRGDLKMPSDACGELWLEEIEKL